MNVLVTGGAGYIGATTAHALAAAGHRPIVFDDFSRGHRAFAAAFPVVEGDVTRPADLDRAFAAHAIGAVVHFAALIEVGESVRAPDLGELARRMKRKVVFDGRNQYSPQKLRGAGFEYFGVGR